jgi:molybdopterin-guanine dinucleotide biosynthesis protein
MMAIGSAGWSSAGKTALLTRLAIDSIMLAKTIGIEDMVG